MTLSRVAIFGSVGACLLALISVPGASIYYHTSWGQGCARCHEIRDNFDSWHSSSHRNINCTTCHDSSLAGNLRRVYLHVTNRAPERIQLRTEDIVSVMQNCRKCHAQEFARWQSGAHSTTFTRILTNSPHNQKRLLMDDCLRCHGMHYAGSIRDAVEPVNTTGPWRLRDATLNGQPAIPCLSCHSVHRDGMPLKKGSPERLRPSAAFFDRRSQLHIGAALLPLPAMLDGGRPVKMSPDPRQSLCYQCHAAKASQQVASGDDRTPVGVHEGLSCLSCHEKHGQDARASCATCHPKFSNCGLDVEKMDTSFLAKNSRHNIHTVKCLDCHPSGVPKSRARESAMAR